jgi:hypothetical protein
MYFPVAATALSMTGGWRIVCNSEDIQRVMVVLRTVSGWDVVEM